MGNAYELVAVGTDGSPSSFGAVDRAAALAADTGAGLLIICAYHHDDRVDTTTDASRPGAIQTPDAAQAEHALDDTSVYRVIGSSPAEDILARAHQRATALGPREVTTVAVVGDPAEQVVDTARAHHADLVVVGDRGLNSLRGRLLGSVPQSISHRSAGDVLIVHTSSR